MKKQYKELRKFPRYTKIIQVECIVKSFPDDLIDKKSKIKPGETFRATTINVSQSGILINYDYILPERTILDLFVTDETIASKNNPMKFEVKIAWTKRNAYKIFGRFSAGLHIIKGNKEDIDKLVEHFN
ncbi:MAG: PilZ domain-containing protein [Candidatus Goldbacteria bacterium]|nr:PilZ domain-containing protein [Candidatus Goldiibacteriota bacterium]